VIVCRTLEQRRTQMWWNGKIEGRPLELIGYRFVRLGATVVRCRNDGKVDPATGGWRRHQDWKAKPRPLYERTTEDRVRPDNLVQRTLQSCRVEGPRYLEDCTAHVLFPALCPEACLLA
jgi:hypothetical protein